MQGTRCKEQDARNKMQGTYDDAKGIGELVSIRKFNRKRGRFVWSAAFFFVPLQDKEV
jgi:hypothetical protein